MSEFLKFAFELLSKVVYNLVTWLAAFLKLFITGWVDYFLIFRTYFPTLSIPAKILSVLLMIILIAIPVLIILLLIRRMIMNHQLKADGTDNATLYREIGRLNKQVLDLMDEKNSILALKVNAMGGAERIPYMGASALTDDVVPTLENVTGNEGKAAAMQAKTAAAKESSKLPAGEHRFRSCRLWMKSTVSSSIRYIITTFHWKNLQKATVCLRQARWDFIIHLRLSEDLLPVWLPVSF